MQLVLEKRTERSNTIALVSPLIAIGLTIVTMSVLFAILGKNPILALWVYFIDPLIDSYSLQEIAVKATPLVMIAIGLSLCYLANVWNIGAEGQFLIGAVAGSWLAVKTNGTDAGPWVLPAMLLLGAAAGALYALIPAICRIRFGASEILTSLMLVYVAICFSITSCAVHGAIRPGTTFRPLRSSTPSPPCRFWSKAADCTWARSSRSCRGCRGGAARPNHQGL